MISKQFYRLACRLALKISNTPTYASKEAFGSYNLQDNYFYHRKTISKKSTSSSLRREDMMENLQKRGRPKLEEISSLIQEGAQSKSPIRCRFCKRAFPREKSLQAHQRIHTGERPYRCNHPGCHKSFVQSGQLRTHQRLHTGKSMFVIGEVS